MQLLILSDGVYNDENNRARARKAGELHTVLPDYGRTLIVSGLAMSVLPSNSAEAQDTAPPAPSVEPAAPAVVAIDMSDGVSDQEARAAGQALKQRRKRK